MDAEPIDVAAAVGAVAVGVLDGFGVHDGVALDEFGEFLRGDHAALHDPVVWHT